MVAARQFTYTQIVRKDTRGAESILGLMMVSQKNGLR
jgi:hypothetical protein